MNKSLKRQLLKTFAQMVSDLKNIKEAEIFLSDFFTEVELESYIKRLSAAYWLKKGRDSENIKRNLLTSGLDLQEAVRFLKSKGGKLAIKNIEAEEWANKWAEKFRAFTKQ